MKKRNKTSKDNIKKGVSSRRTKVTFKSDPKTPKLIKVARIATASAIRASRALGLPITYMQNGKLYREFVDSSKEVIFSVPQEKANAKNTTMPLRKGMVFMQVNKRLKVFAGPDGSGKSTLFNVFKKNFNPGISLMQNELEKLLNNSGLIDLNAFDISAIPND